MIKIIIQICFIFLISFAPGIGGAQAETPSGLAMHGNPKYGPDFTHLDYVNPDAPKGGTLKQAAIGTFDSLNPFALKGKAAQGLNLVYDRLMARVWDEPFTMYPLVAQSVDIPEDRSSLTVHINPKAKFSDGSAVTADDVLFSFQTLRDSGRPNMQRIYKLADEAKKIDDHTVYFHFGPGYDRETVMIYAMMPVLSKQWWSGKKFDSGSMEVPVTNGPYKIAAVEQNHRIVYQRDPNYWAKDLPVNKGQYNFDRVIYDYYRDDTVAFEAFKAGDFDLRRELDANKWATLYDFPAIEKGEVIKQDLPHQRPERVRSFIFNTRRAPFDDIRVREALNLALDFDWMNKNLFHSQYKRITSYFPNSILAASSTPSDDELKLLDPFKDELPASVFGPSWQPDNGDTRTRLRKASEILKQAGWIIKDGKRINEKTGKPLTFEILLDSPEDEKVALTYAGSLKRLGIEATVRVLDTAAFRRRLNDYDYDMILHYWTNSLSPGSEQTQYWGCEAAKLPAHLNYAGICDKAVDSLAQGIADSKTYDDLKAHAHALDRVLMANYYIIPLYYSGADYVAFRKFIHHPDNTPLYGMVLESWWANQKAEAQDTDRQ